MEMIFVLFFSSQRCACALHLQQVTSPLHGASVCQELCMFFY